MTDVIFSGRALEDLAAIRDYSASTWGDAVAAHYIKKFADAADLLAGHPGLLREHTAYPGPLRFYRVEQHWLICAEAHGTICIIAIMHVALDLPRRLYVLEPTLMGEAKRLLQRLRTT